MRDIKYRAKRDGISFELTQEHLQNILDAQGHRCYYSGHSLTFGARDKEEMARTGVSTGNISLDRTLSNKGYTPDNVHFVTKTANLAKHTNTPNEFINLCSAVVSTNNQKINMEHSILVKRLAKSGDDIVKEMTATDAHIMHMVIGVSGEAGELLDAIKKAVIYRKPLDRENIIEELGDLEFFMEGLRAALNITREECIEGNIAKLSKRYASLSYSDSEAQNRADKQ